jgi:hypothetical protein
MLGASLAARIEVADLSHLNKTDPADLILLSQFAEDEVRGASTTPGHCPTE